MNFADEPYVRVYKRRTTTLAVVGWQARAILRELFLVVDRAGVLDLDDEDPADAVAAVLGDVPVEIVRDSLVKLEQKHCVIINTVTKRDATVRCLIIPKFREAQETPASDRLRAKESRERRRTDAMANDTVTNCDDPVTESDASVTTGHTESHAVTQSNAEHCKAEHDMSSNAPPSEKRTRKREIPEVMPSDWEPTTGLIEALATKFQTTPDRIRDCIPEFRNYWTQGKGCAKRRGPSGWETTFSKRISAIAERGELYIGPEMFAGASRSGHRPPQPNDPTNRYQPVTE